MTNDIQERLREDIDRFTAGARAPAGMVRRAEQRNRRHRAAIVATAAAGTALVAAVAVISVTGSPQPSGPDLRAQTVAYVTSRAEHALAAVAQAKAIEVVRATARNAAFGFTVLNMALSEQPNPTGSAVVPGVLGSVKAQRTTSWFYRGLMLQEGFTPTGKLVFNSSIGPVTSAAGKQVLETYGAAWPVRTRWRALVVGKNGTLPKPTCVNAFPNPATPDLRATIVKALSCRLYALDGHQQIDGVNAIKLVLNPRPGLPVRETLWLDPSTYLPLRTTTAFLAPHGRESLLVQDYQWLPSTTANLATLHATIRHATIPAGFRKLPSAELPLVGFDTSQTVQP